MSFSKLSSVGPCPVCWGTLGYESGLSSGTGALELLTKLKVTQAYTAAKGITKRVTLDEPGHSKWRGDRK